MKRVSVPRAVGGFCGSGRMFERTNACFEKCQQCWPEVWITTWGRITVTVRKSPASASLRLLCISVQPVTLTLIIFSHLAEPAFQSGTVQEIMCWAPIFNRRFPGAVKLLMFWINSWFYCRCTSCDKLWKLPFLFTMSKNPNNFKNRLCKHKAK